MGTGALVPSGYGDEYERLIERVRDGQVVRGLATKRKRRDGALVDVEVWAAPLRDADDELVATIATFVDVRDREIRVQQLQVLHRILRHNLRNELSIVRGYADLLVDEVDDPRARGHAETIREAGDRLSALAERVHELRSESARTETIDLADVAETECDRLRAAYPGASISCRTPEEGWIRAVPGIDRVVREAVENGIVHNDRDRPSVTVSVETGDDEYVVARIADDGPGIPADEWRAVERGQETPTSHESGVGLWLVRWLTVRSGGEVDVSERDTRGTVVTVKLPKAPS